MKIELLKKYYSVLEMSELYQINKDTLYSRIKSLNIVADLKINGILNYVEESKNKILQFHEFEKTFNEIIYHERNNKNLIEKFEIFESKIN